MQAKVQTPLQSVGFLERSESQLHLGSAFNCLQRVADHEVLALDESDEETGGLEPEQSTNPAARTDRYDLHVTSDLFVDVLGSRAGFYARRSQSHDQAKSNGAYLCPANPA